MQLYEPCIEAYTMLAKCYSQKKDYNLLMHSLNGCNQITVSLIKAVSINIILIIKQKNNKKKKIGT